MSQSMVRSWNTALRRNWIGRGRRDRRAGGSGRACRWTWEVSLSAGINWAPA